MAATLVTVRREIRRWMRDTSPRQYAVTTLELDRIIESMARDVDSDVDSGQVWSLAAITLNPATIPPDYTLAHSAGTIEYQNILDLRRHADSYILRRRSQEHISQVRWANANASASQVSEYALVPTITGTYNIITVMFDVVPTVVDTIDVLAARAMLQTAWFHQDTVVVPFPLDFMNAFQQGCAARGIGMMSQTEREKRGFAPDYLAQLDGAYQKGLRKEKLRNIRLALAEGGADLRPIGWWN